MYPEAMEIMRDSAANPEPKRIVICIAIGYPDWGFPANKIETAREPIDTHTTWCDFE